MTAVLIVYYSRHGSVARMAEYLAEGVESVTDCSAIVRTVPEVSAETEQTAEPIPQSGPPYVTEQDLNQCNGLIIGSPSYFGNMAAPMKYFIDQGSKAWMSGALIGKPAGVFTACSSLHGGMESVLLSMMIPLLHHGMLITGIPYSEASLHQTDSGGTPYGASHVAGSEGKPHSEDEITLCRAQGKRIAEIARQLNA